MNNIKLSFFVIALLLMFSACEEPGVSSLSVKTSLDGATTVLRSGDSIELEIKAEDSEGISSVEVVSTELGIQELYDQIGKKNWNRTETLTIDASISPGTLEIQVTMTNDLGEQKFSSASLEIQ